MQIDWSTIIPSTELFLVILIVSYLVIAIGVGSYRLHKYLKLHPDETQGKDYHFQHSNASLTLAGFSITAIALLVAVRYGDPIAVAPILNAISPTLAFFALSFLFLIMSPILLSFRFVNFFIYVADVLFRAGLLSIACGFLVFFSETTLVTEWTSIVFVILFISLFIASLANYVLYESVVRIKKEDPEEAKDTNSKNSGEKPLVEPTNSSFWTATVKDIENGFEETRSSLIKTYHSYVQTHAGYIIALIIGLFTVVSRFDAFIAYGFEGIVGLIAVILLILGICSFMGLRIVYWSMWASSACAMAMDDIIHLFNKKNSTYHSKAPNTQIIQIAITEELKDQRNKGVLPFFKELAIKTARKSFDP